MWELFCLTSAFIFSILSLWTFYFGIIIDLQAVTKIVWRDPCTRPSFPQWLYLTFYSRDTTRNLLWVCVGKLQCHFITGMNSCSHLHNQSYRIFPLLQWSASFIIPVTFCLHSTFLISNFLAMFSVVSLSPCVLSNFMLVSLVLILFNCMWRHLIKAVSTL